jgi:hypothetical protein
MEQLNNNVNAPLIVSQKPPDVGERYQHDYYGEKLYCIVTTQSVDLMMTEPDRGLGNPLGVNRTLTGLGIISSLITLLLEYEIDPKDIAGSIWENSREKGDLADILSLDLLRTMEKHKEKEFE